MKDTIKSVKVWDIFVRIFYWTIVGSIFGMFLTGDDFKNIHMYLGYFVIVLIFSRILWGFLGSKHARFSDFIYKPGTIYEYLKGLVNGSPTHYLGHNPAGGLMVIVMLISLLITAFAGLKTLGSEGRGPLANNDISIVRPAFADEDEHNEGSVNKGSRRQKEQKSEFWEEIHEGMTGFIIFLVIAHVCGVIVSSWVHKENLILGMITGRKVIE